MVLCQGKAFWTVIRADVTQLVTRPHPDSPLAVSLSVTHTRAQILINGYL